MRATRELPAAEADLLDAELAREAARKLYQAVRAAAVAERVPAMQEKMRSAIGKLDAALEVAREANNAVVAAWVEASEVLGADQHDVPSDLRWVELLPESANTASRLDTWRRYCAQYGWL